MDLIPGGLASGKKPSDFSSRSLKKGMRVEREHSSDPRIQREIVMDHLTEDSRYYEELAKMERKMNKTSHVHSLIKNAKIFGTSHPGDVLYMPELPYEHRKKRYEDYLKRKSVEEPTSRLKAIGVGALSGGLLGGATGWGIGEGRRDAMLGALGGAATGGLLGLSGSIRDRQNIERAKQILRDNGVDDALADEITRGIQNKRRMEEVKELSKTLDEERKHRELIDAIHGGPYKKTESTPLGGPPPMSSLREEVKPKPKTYSHEDAHGVADVLKWTSVTNPMEEDQVHTLANLEGLKHKHHKGEIDEDEFNSQSTAFRNEFRNKHGKDVNHPTDVHKEFYDILGSMKKTSQARVLGMLDELASISA